MSDKAGRYSRIKYALAVIDTVYLLALLVLLLRSGFSAWLAAGASAFIKANGFVFPAYLLALFILSSVATFPLNFYRTFILEHKFNLTEQKFSAWLTDQLKTGVLSYIIGVILFSAFYNIVNRNPHAWWFIVAVSWVIFSLIVAKLLPVMIIPLFFKYKRLEDPALREKVAGLAEKMRIKIMDVFEIDFSKKTLKANAAFVGWGKTRRVILADTLKDKYSCDEIEAILAHEFAHYRMKHLLKLVLINAAATFLLFYLISISSAYCLGLFGLISLKDIATFPLIIMYMTAFGIIMQPLDNSLSRHFEKDADLAALKATGNKEAFISMMNKLSDQNLADRNPHPLVKFFFFDHPPTSERIAVAMSYDLKGAAADG